MLHGGGSVCLAKVHLDPTEVKWEWDSAEPHLKGTWFSTHILSVLLPLLLLSCMTTSPADPHPMVRVKVHLELGGQSGTSSLGDTFLLFVPQHKHTPGRQRTGFDAFVTPPFTHNHSPPLSPQLPHLCMTEPALWKLADGLGDV